MEAIANIFGEDKKPKKKVYSKKLNFNILKQPGAANLSFALLLFAIAGGLIFFSNLVPQLNRESVKEAVIESTRSFELEDEVNGGLFSLTNRKGDTIVSNCKLSFFPVSFFLFVLLFVLLPFPFAQPSFLLPGL